MIDSQKRNSLAVGANDEGQDEKTIALLKNWSYLMKRTPAFRASHRGLLGQAQTEAAEVHLAHDPEKISCLRAPKKKAGPIRPASYHS
jgi:hypothetical protein